GGDVKVVEIFDLLFDVADAHVFGVQGDDDGFHSVGNVLPFGNQHRLKGAFSVSGNLDFGLSVLVAELFLVMPVTGVFADEFSVLLIAQVVVHFSFQDGFYTPLLELAQKSVKLFSVFELLEEFCAECVFFFHSLMCVKVSRKSYFRNFSRPLKGPKNSRITFPTTYTLIGTIPGLRFYNVGCINSSVCSF